MKPAMPTAARSRASRTLTAAMMASSRFVVPRLPSMCVPSERRCLMGVLISRRLLPALAQRVVQQFPAFAGDPRSFLHRGAKTDELTGEVFKGRFDLPSQRPAVIREKEISCRP